MFAAYFLADGDARHTISVRRFQHTAEYDIDQFVKRMTHPEVGVWWVWVEEVEETNESHTSVD
jgi:hypothetical protein